MSKAKKISKAVLDSACACLLLCAPFPTDPLDEESTVFRLSLEEIGRKSAEFSGAPIEAIIELDRDTSFGSIYWHTGQGDPPRCADTAFNKPSKRFTAVLFWTKYPLVKDSSDNCYYDTIWASMGGGVKKSNKVRVKVTNLPVFIDSCRFDSSLFRGNDTLWLCSLSARLKDSYQLNVYARDLDNKTVSLQIIGNKGIIIRSGVQALSMKYEPPEGDFIDTIRFIASDHKGGQAIRTLIIRHITPNTPPIIDSIQVNTTMLKTSSMVGGIYRVGFPAFDTLRLRLFAHDSGGSISRVAWRAKTNRLVVDSVNNMLALFICSGGSCTDTLRDTSVVVDTITITVSDNRGDSTVRRIELSKGTINQPPQIKKLQFGSSAVVLSDTFANVKITGGAEYLIKVNASDPEKKPLTTVWSCYPSSRLTGKTDSTARYTAPERLDTDTVKISVSDGILTVNIILRIVIDDIIPVFDSIVVKGGDTVLKGADTVFSVSVSPKDTLLFIAFATDRDSADSMIYSWSSGKEARFILRSGNKAGYVLPDTALRDTVALTIQDGGVKLSRKIVVKPANSAPVIDSITAEGKRLSMNGGFFRHTAAATDTIEYKVSARDPDGDKIYYKWNAADTTLLSSKSGESIEYRCRDAAYSDTLTVTVEDENGKNISKKIIVKVDKR